MKLRYCIPLILAAMIYANPISAQCDEDSFLDDCAAKLETYTFLKAYKIQEKKSKKGSEGAHIEYRYVLSKGSSYKILACSGSEQMVVKLFDRNKKQIASSYNKRTRKHYPVIGYSCMATGVYTLQFSFQGDTGGCGVCILGLKKN